MAVRQRNTSAYGLNGTSSRPACAPWLWGNMGAGTSLVSGFFLIGRAGSGPVFRRNRIVSRRKLPEPFCNIHGAGKAMFVSGYACSSSLPYRRQHFFAFTVTFNRTRRNTTRMTDFLLPLSPRTLSSRAWPGCSVKRMSNMSSSASCF